MNLLQCIIKPVTINPIIIDVFNQQSLSACSNVNYLTTLQTCYRIVTRGGKVADNGERKIKVVNNGPYIVTGDVPLTEKIILPKGDGYEYTEGQELPQASVYALCRCGNSKNAPFCDGTHMSSRFNGEETASRDSFAERAEVIEGEGVDLLDDQRCAFARFCHRENGSTVWELTEASGDDGNREEAIRGACECPAGRLVARDKDGRMIEQEYEAGIDILQDPEEEVSGGIYVKGNIPVEAADGSLYEVRNRVVLCRCGKSDNKPFCDASHVSEGYTDKTVK
ncbi:MAG: iron-binding protein [Clostridiales bacterium]|nr:iron-binding protein [Clostridiales bacterium]